MEASDLVKWLSVELALDLPSVCIEGCPVSAISFVAPDLVSSFMRSYARYASYGFLSHSGMSCDEVDTSGPSGNMLLTSLKMHLNEKMLGIVKRKITLAQDLLAAFEKRNEDSKIGKELKKWNYEINKLLIPWWKLVFKLEKNKHYRKFDSVIRNNQQVSSGEDEHTVYIRVNLENNDYYVRKTSHFEDRFCTHFASTKSHRIGTCKGCREHLKYKRGAKIAEYKWSMIPIVKCSTEAEAYQVESWLISRWKPPINSSKPVWYQKYLERLADVRTKRYRKRPRFRRNPDQVTNRDITFTEYVDIATGKSW